MQGRDLEQSPHLRPPSWRAQSLCASAPCPDQHPASVIKPCPPTPTIKGGLRGAGIAHIPMKHSHGAVLSAADCGPGKRVPSGALVQVIICSLLSISDLGGAL